MVTRGDIQNLFDSYKVDKSIDQSKNTWRKMLITFLQSQNVDQQTISYIISDLNSFEEYYSLPEGGNN